jgi:hypothetical protein
MVDNIGMCLAGVCVVSHWGNSRDLFVRHFLRYPRSIGRDEEEEKKVDAGKRDVFEDLGKDGEFQGRPQYSLFKITKDAGEKRGEDKMGLIGELPGEQLLSLAWLVRDVALKNTSSVL